MPRLFVALSPPTVICGQLLDLMEGVDGARWQDEDQLHLTLRFIGEVDPRTADDVAMALAQLGGAAFDVALSGVGTFARQGRMHTLWAGVQPREPLAALHKRIDRAVSTAGLPPERRAYHPHITLARLNRSSAPVAGFLGRHAGLSGTPWRCDHFALFESVLGRSGAIYEEIARWPLS